jgi:hypothetical protein
MKIYCIAKNKKEYLTPQEMAQVKARFQDIQCTFAKDDEGYYCYTHRARSKSYPSIDKIPKNKVDFINSTSSSNKNIKVAMNIDDVFALYKDATNDILNEFFSRGRKKGSKMSWSVIPFARLRKIWEDYMRDGVVHDTVGVDEIANQMLKILARLTATNELSGHSNIDPEEIIEEHGYKLTKRNKNDFYWNFLETQYGTPVSDYGLPKLWSLARNLMSASSYEETVLYIDQMLNVVHQRGDLAALFIEGGSTSLSQLSGSPSEIKKEIVAMNSNWYKRAIKIGMDWTKEEKLQDILSPKERDMIEYLIRFHNDEWVDIDELREQAKDYMFPGINFNFPQILSMLIKKGLIIENKARGELHPWVYWQIKLTDKGKYT